MPKKSITKLPSEIDDAIDIAISFTAAACVTAGISPEAMLLSLGKAAGFVAAAAGLRKRDRDATLRVAAELACWQPPKKTRTGGGRRKR